MRRRLYMVLTLVLCFAFTVPVFAAEEGSMDHFSVKETYAAGQFADVDETAWYGTKGQGVVKTACQLGIMNGMGDGTFAPTADIRISELIKMACVVHSIYNGGDGTVPAGSPWYQGYVDYAIENGIVAKDDYTDYEAYARRSDLAYIFAHALPEGEYGKINTINGVSDLPAGAGHREEIFLLYRAGVLTGDADTHKFRPEDKVTRAEAAAIIARAVTPSSRVHFEILPISGDTAVHTSYALMNEKGAALALGQQPASVFKNFFGATSTEAQYGSYTDAKVVMPSYPGVTDLRYLLSDFAGGGVYIYYISVTDPAWSLENGIHCGSTESELKAAYAESELRYEDHTKNDAAEEGDGGATYVYYPGDGSPWCSISFQTEEGKVTEITLNCSLS